MSANEITLSDEGFSDIEVVRTFMQGVDVVTSVRKLDSVKDYLELLELFYTDGENKLNLLNFLLRDDDLDRYTIEVHGLKSAAANIGAEELSLLAKAHEDAGKAKKEDWIWDNIDPLKEQYEAILTEIRRVLELWQFGIFKASDTSTLPPIEKEEMTGRMEKALGFLEDFEPKDAADEIDALLGFYLPENIRGDIEKVRSLLKVYEDEQAEELLRSLMS